MIVYAGYLLDCLARSNLADSVRRRPSQTLVMPAHVNLAFIDYEFTFTLEYRA